MGFWGLYLQFKGSGVWVFWAQSFYPSNPLGGSGDDGSVFKAISAVFQVSGPLPPTPDVGALRITYTILGAPDYSYSTMGPIQII